MISMKKKRALRSALAITICTVTIASVNTPVYSAPSTDELESTTSGLKGELNDLNSQLSSLSKELDNTSSQDLRIYLLRLKNPSWISLLRSLMKKRSMIR